MEALVGLILWILANWVYVDMRRRGERGVKRFFAFWLGWPGTFVGMLSVEEGSQPTVRNDDRDLRSLVEDIRRDRVERVRWRDPLPEAAAERGEGGREPEESVADESGEPLEEER